MISVHTEQCFLINIQTAQATSEPSFIKKLYFPIKNHFDFEMVSSFIIIDHEYLAKKLLKVLEGWTWEGGSCKWSFEVFTGWIMKSN